MSGEYFVHESAYVDQPCEIGSGTKIGDMVHVGHNCEIGDDSLLFPTTAISGSVKVGKGVFFLGRSGSYDNITIGDGAVVGACAVAYKDVAPGEFVLGLPAKPKGQELRIRAGLNRLPDMIRDIRAIKKKLDL